jgi:hypothetical protein
MAKNDAEAAALYAVMKEALSVFGGGPLSLEQTERMAAKVTAYAAIADQLLERTDSNTGEDV